MLPFTARLIAGRAWRLSRDCSRGTQLPPWQPIRPAHRNSAQHIPQAVRNTARLWLKPPAWRAGCGRPMSAETTAWRRLETTTSVWHGSASWDTGGNRTPPLAVAGGGERGEGAGRDPRWVGVSFHCVLTGSSERPSDAMSTLILQGNSIWW